MAASRKIAKSELIDHKLLRNHHPLHATYSVIRRACPWAKEFRAGIVVWVNNAVLCVHQRPARCAGNNLPMRKGFPKGAACSIDSTALATARRELYEETGVIATNVLPCPIMIPRPETGELFIYFVCKMDHEPNIKICEKELVGYEWCRVDALRRLHPVTIPTTLLIGTLELVDFS